MERFYLEEPSLKRKDAAIDYINEHIYYGSNINGVGGLDRILNEGWSYEEWLEKLGKEPEREVYLNKILDQIDKIEKKSIKFFIKNQDKYLNKIYKKRD